MDPGDTGRRRCRPAGAREQIDGAAILEIPSRRSGDACVAPRPPAGAPAPAGAPVAPSLTFLPGARQRRRLLVLLLACGLLVLLRPYWPLNLLPGWSVGLLPLWTVLELVRLAWWPQRWH